MKKDQRKGSHIWIKGVKWSCSHRNNGKSAPVTLLAYICKHFLTNCLLIAFVRKVIKSAVSVCFHSPGINNKGHRSRS